MYKSPIEIIAKDVERQLERDTFRVIQSYGINVDKEELIRALQYDRKQYEKGYADGLSEGCKLTDELILEIGHKICKSYEECSENCPGFNYCSKGNNGIVVWLRKVLNGNDD